MLEADIGPPLDAHLDAVTPQTSLAMVASAREVFPDALCVAPVWDERRRLVDLVETRGAEIDADFVWIVGS